jgi:hypothetical protein
MNFESLKVGQKLVWAVTPGQGWNSNLNGTILLITKITNHSAYREVCLENIKSSPIARTLSEQNWASKDNPYFMHKSEIESEKCPVKRSEPLNYTYRQLLESIEK